MIINGSLLKSIRFDARKSLNIPMMKIWSFAVFFIDLIRLTFFVTGGKDMLRKQLECMQSVYSKFEMPGNYHLKGRRLSSALSHRIWLRKKWLALNTLSHRFIIIYTNHGTSSKQDSFVPPGKSHSALQIQLLKR